MTLRAGLALHGVGNVGARFLDLARAAGVPVVAVHDSRGRIEGDGDARAARAGVFVDATPSHYDGPQAASWIEAIEDQLRAGTHVVTCNKAPLALATDRLLAAARSSGATLACSGTVGGGTPVLATLRRIQATHGLVGVQATLSGTLSFVCAQVCTGRSLAEAVAEAQRQGLAEPDPRLDLDGTDAWAKAVILHNALFPAAPPLLLSSVRQPIGLSESAIRAAARGGRAAAVVADIRPGSVRLSLRPRWADGPAGHIEVRALHADGGYTDLSGAGAGAQATAAVLLADARAVLAGQAAPGLWP